MAQSKTSNPVSGPVEVVQLALGAIAQSAFSHRSTMDETQLQELADSIKTQGVLQPLVVRPRKGKPAYEIVCGRRRLAAAQLAGLATVPALVRDLNDAQAAEAQLVENLQRSDVHELDEAEGYKVLHEAHGLDVDTIAERVGKSRRYVYARMQLLTLSKGAAGRFRKGDISASVALLVARIPHSKLQAEAVKAVVASEYREALSYREAKRLVERDYMCKLSDATWKPGDAELDPKAGACTKCPKRSGNNPDLFSDVEGGANICTDPVCYARKRDLAWKRRAGEHREAGGKVLDGKQGTKVYNDVRWGDNGRGDYVNLDTACHSDDKGRTWRRLLGKACPTPTVVRDTETAEVVEVLDRKAAREVLKQRHPDLGKRTKATASPADRKHKLEAKVGRQTADQVQDHVSSHIGNLDLNDERTSADVAAMLCRAAVGVVWDDALKAVCRRRELEPAKRDHSKYDGAVLAFVAQLQDGRACNDLWGLLAELLLERYADGDAVGKYTRAYHRPVIDAAELTQLDLAATRKAVAAELQAAERERAARAKKREQRKAAKAKAGAKAGSKKTTTTKSKGKGARQAGA